MVVLRKGILKRVYDGQWWWVTATTDLGELSHKVPDILPSSVPVVQKINEMRFLVTEKQVKQTLEEIAGQPIEWEVAR